jgi:hypothetical protein
MKVKVKLDKDAILGGLIAHGEKIAFGVFLLMFVLLCFGALKQSPYDKTPDKFIAEANRVEQLVSNAVLPPDTERKKLPPVVVIETTEIPVETYATTKGINEPPGQSGSQRRGEPKYLAVQDLQVGTEYGAVAVKPAGAPAGNVKQAAPVAQPVPGGDIQGKQWAVITGVVPSPQQVKEYRSTFAGAPQPGHDLPQWRKFEVQRQEGEGPWTPLNLQAIEAAEPAHVVAEPEAPELKNFTSIPQVCHPAPKMVNDKLHDKSIMHPKIAALAAEGVKPLAQPVINNNPNGPRGPEILPEHATEQLFRCFDYTVQPGKSYRYKVQLVLLNPNYGLQRYEVKNGEMLKVSTRASAWSEPSPVLNVPAASSILAGPVERAKSPSQEAMSQSILRMWNPERAIDALKFSRLWRGQVANYSVNTPVKPPEGGKAAEELVHFKTDLVLIDMAGGESLPTYRGRSPGRMLLLSPTGELDVKSELVDSNSFDSEVDRIATLAKEAAPEPEPPPRAAAPRAEDDGDRKNRRGGERGKRDQQ